MAEPEALKHSFRYLVDSIDTDAVLSAALSSDLITDRQRTECANESNPYKKAETFLGYVQRAVNGDPHKFDDFLDTLQNTSQKELVSRLRGTPVTDLASCKNYFSGMNCHYDIIYNHVDELCHSSIKKAGKSSDEGIMMAYNDYSNVT